MVVGTGQDNRPKAIALPSEMKKSAWEPFYAALDAVCTVAKETVESVVRYFTNNRSRMDYAQYLKQGLCIGSGQRNALRVLS